MELWAEITWDKEACIRCQVMAVMAVTIKTEVTIIEERITLRVLQLGSEIESFLFT